jgi:hypothetical protein
LDQPNNIITNVEEQHTYRIMEDDAFCLCDSLRRKSDIDNNDGLIMAITTNNFFSNINPDFFASADYPPHISACDIIVECSLWDYDGTNDQVTNNSDSVDALKSFRAQYSVFDRGTLNIACGGVHTASGKMIMNGPSRPIIGSFIIIEPEAVDSLLTVMIVNDIDGGCLRREIWNSADGDINSPFTPAQIVGEHNTELHEVHDSFMGSAIAVAGDVAIASPSTPDTTLTLVEQIGVKQDLRLSTHGVITLLRVPVTTDVSGTPWERQHILMSAIASFMIEVKLNSREICRSAGFDIIWPNFIEQSVTFKTMDCMTIDAASYCWLRLRDGDLEICPPAAHACAAYCPCGGWTDPTHTDLTCALDADKENAEDRWRAELHYPSMVLIDRRHFSAHPLTNTSDSPKATPVACSSYFQLLRYLVRLCLLADNLRAFDSSASLWGEICPPSEHACGAYCACCSRTDRWIDLMHYGSATDDVNAVPAGNDDDFHVLLEDGESQFLPQIMKQRRLCSTELLNFMCWYTVTCTQMIVLLRYISLQTLVLMRYILRLLFQARERCMPLCQLLTTMGSQVLSLDTVRREYFPCFINVTVGLLSTHKLPLYMTPSSTQHLRLRVPQLSVRESGNNAYQQHQVHASYADALNNKSHDGCWHAEQDDTRVRPPSRPYKPMTDDGGTVLVPVSYTDALLAKYSLGSVIHDLLEDTLWGEIRCDPVYTDEMSSITTVRLCRNGKHHDNLDTRGLRGVVLDIVYGPAFGWGSIGNVPIRWGEAVIGSTVPYVYVTLYFKARAKSSFDAQSQIHDRGNPYPHKRMKLECKTPLSMLPITTVAYGVFDDDGKSGVFVIKDPITYSVDDNGQTMHKDRSYRPQDDGEHAFGVAGVAKKQGCKTNYAVAYKPCEYIPKILTRMLHDITVGNSIVVTTPTDVEVANPRRIFPINSTTAYESTIERTDPTQLSTGIKRVLLWGAVHSNLLVGIAVLDNDDKSGTWIADPNFIYGSEDDETASSTDEAYRLSNDGEQLMVTTSPFNVMESPLKEQIENEKQGTSSSTRLSKTKDAHGSLFKRMTDAGVQSLLCSTHVSLQILISVLSSIVTSLRNYPSCGRLRNMFDPLMSTALLVRDIHLRRFVRWIIERMGSPTISIDRGVSENGLVTHILPLCGLDIDGIFRGTRCRQQDQGFIGSYCAITTDRGVMKYAFYAQYNKGYLWIE